MSVLQPYSAFEDLYRPFEGLFNLNQPTAPNSPSRWLPAVDIKSGELGFSLEMEVPGFQPDEVEVEAHDGVLTIKGERVREEASDTENIVRSERYHGTFCRKFTLPDGTQTEDISAEVKNGLLLVMIPHVPPAEPKKISVS